MIRQILTGAAAGAAGTTALNAVTYLDMAIRARPTSSTPEDTVDELADRTPFDIPGQGDTRDNRVAGLGPLMGLATGVAVGAAYGAVTALLNRPRPGWGSVLVGGAAMLAGNGPMTLLGLTDPREWDAASWMADVVPHMAYGVVTATTFEATQP
ncbi:MAG: hypothetical protein H0T17_08075 [Propionibacteriales bacterium]|nr:hypothetical protein [Propionibacteriales bacterium]